MIIQSGWIHTFEVNISLPFSAYNVPYGRVASLSYV